MGAAARPPSEIGRTVRQRRRRRSRGDAAVSAASADAAGARRGVQVMGRRRRHCRRGTGNAPGDAGASPPTAAAALGRAGLLGEADHDAQDEGGGQFAGVLGGQDRPGKRVRFGRQRDVMQRRRRIGMRQQHDVVGGVALLAVGVYGFHV